jgi:uncharacterized membrane protein
VSKEYNFENLKEFESVLKFELRKRKFSQEELEDITNYYVEIINERMINGEPEKIILSEYDPARIAFFMEPETRFKRLEKEESKGLESKLEADKNNTKNVNNIKTYSSSKIVDASSSKNPDKINSKIEKRNRTNSVSIKSSTSNFVYVIKYLFGVPTLIPFAILFVVFFIVYIAFFISVLGIGIGSVAFLAAGMLKIFTNAVPVDTGLVYLGLCLVILSVSHFICYYLGIYFKKLSKLSLLIVTKITHSLRRKKI